MSRIFITGGTGFIGRHLVDLLIKKGFYLNLVTRNKDHGFIENDRLRVYIGDFTDYQFVEDVMQGCSKVFHLAAKISFNNSDAEEVMRVNVGGTKNLLDISLGIGIEQFIFISSAITVGISHNKERVLDEACFACEEDIKSNIYLRSKIEAEKLVLASNRESFRTVCLNPTTVFGRGDHSLNSGSLVKMAASSSFLLVPSGGTSVVDVEDAARGIVLAMEKARPAQRYILTNENLSFLQLFKDISETIGRKPIFIRIPRFSRPILRQAVFLKNKMMAFLGENNWLITPQVVEDTFNFKYYSSRKAQDELGWLPEVKFRESVRQAWQYYLKNNLLN